MVLAQEKMDVERSRSDSRRVSSPITIPAGKLAHLHRLAEKREANLSPVSSPGNYPTPPFQSHSLPTPVRYMHLSRISSDGLSEEAIDEEVDHLPECSPAFTAVFSELVKLDEDKHENDSESSGSLPPPEADSVHSTPNLPRKELRFALDEEFEKMRLRTSTHSFGKKSRRRNAPSSTHSTPSLSRRSKNTILRPVNVAPKYKFLTETVTVSHEDIVQEQQKQSSRFGSPKSIFSLAGI